MALLQDVASQAGVSLSTASRALSRPEMVSRATRERVLAAARELEFVPNRAARALITGRTGLLGLVLPTLSSQYFAPLVFSAQEAAEGYGQQLLVGISEYSAEREQRILAGLLKEVDGLIMVAPLSPERVLTDIANSCPLIVLDRKIRRLPHIYLDQTTGPVQLANHLLALGHHNIAYIGGPPGSWMDTARREAIEATTGRELTCIGPLQPTFAAGVAAVEQLPPSATAVIAFSSYLALGLLHGLTVAGIKVPHDLSIAAADDFAGLAHTTPSITALTAPAADAAKLAVTALQNSADGHRPKTQRIPTSLIPRASTATARSQSRAPAR